MDRKYIKPYDQGDLVRDISRQFGEHSPQFEVLGLMAAELEEHGIAPVKANLQVNNKMDYCAGCYNDHYNTRVADDNVQRHMCCWSLESAKIIPRKRVHINDRPPWNHTPELYPSCYREPKYIFAREKQTY
jgi:hypothetical protein